MKYDIHSVASNVFQIALHEPYGSVKGDDELTQYTNNIYVIKGQALTLINAGHPAQLRALSNAIRELGFTISDVERIIYTSWDIDSLGGASNFPRADHFVFSPDMVKPLNYEAFIARERNTLLQLYNELKTLADSALESSQMDALEQAILDHFPTVTSNLFFIPIQDEQSIRAGDMELEIIASPGPSQGHINLYAPDQKWLFSGSFSLIGIPRKMVALDDYLNSYERLLQLEPDVVLPDSGKYSPMGTWALARGYRFLNNFLNSAPNSLHTPTTILEFIEKDLGYKPEPSMETLYRVRAYHKLFEEMVKNNTLQAEGTGLQRTYRSYLDDSRAPLRRS